jgi:hypothetical protein
MLEFKLKRNGPHKVRLEISGTAYAWHNLHLILKRDKCQASQELADALEREFDKYDDTAELLTAPAN